MKKCPNCGREISDASLTCRWCGQHLYRFDGDPENIPVIPGLVEELEKNLAKQSTTSDEVLTNIYIPDETSASGVEMTVFVESAKTATWMDNSRMFPARDTEALGCSLLFAPLPGRPMTPANSLEEKRRRDLFDAFNSGRMFAEHCCSTTDFWGNDCTYYEYAIDFGRDVENAAKVISLILAQVFTVGEGTSVDWITSAGQKEIERANQLLIPDAVTAIKNQTRKKTYFRIGLIIGFLILGFALGFIGDLL